MDKELIKPILKLDDYADEVNIKYDIVSTIETLEREAEQASMENSEHLEQ